MSLEINTAIARAAYEAERSYIAATEGPQAQGPEWSALTREQVERARIGVLKYLQGGEEPADTLWVWRRVVDVMAQALR